MARNKRSQKAQAELEQLETANKNLEAGGSGSDGDEPSSEGEPSSRPAASSSSFAAFAALDDVQQSDQSEAEDDAGPITQTTQPSTTISAGKKKKNNKKKKKAKSAVQSSEPQQEAPLDEVDAALKDLGLDPVPFVPAVQPSARTLMLRDLVHIDPKQLDPDLELRRMFGASVVSSVNTSSSPLSQYSGARKSQAQRIMGVHAKTRSLFAKPTPTWSPVAWVKSGLSQEVDQHFQIGAKSTEQWFTFTHSKSYKVCTYEFLAAVAASDVQGLMALLRTNPYHIETLLVLSDMAAQQGDPGQSDDFTHRALYGLEGASAPGFSFANGTARLVFDRVENRGMFRALDKRVNGFMKRGTWRAACESAKALFALDPWSDPYGALLHLDFLAVKARQGSWLLQLLDNLPSIYDEAEVPIDGRLKLDTYPGLAFARALILFDQEEGSDSKQDDGHEKSRSYLLNAVLTFPFVVPILFDKLGLNIPPVFLSHPRAGLRTSFDRSKPDSFLHLLGQLYVHRSESLFKPPEILEWLQETVKRAESSLDDTTQQAVQRGQSFADGSGLYGQDVIPAGILRHLIAADIVQLRPHLPPGLLASITNTYDPLPPSGGTTYDDDYFAGVITGQRSMPGAGGRMGEQQIRAALERILAAAGDGEGDPELQAALQAQFGGVDGAGLPGGLPDEEDEGEGNQLHQDAGEEPRAVAGGWGQMIQNWLGLGGGQTGPQADEPEQEDGPAENRN